MGAVEGMHSSLSVEKLTLGVDVGALVLQVALNRVEVIRRLTQALEVVVTFRWHWHRGNAWFLENGDQRR